MTTTISRTIGSTGYYSDMASWEDDSPPNLVSVDQVWEGRCLNEEFSSTTNLLTVGGQTTDETRYVHLTADTACSFVDHASKLTNALRYNASNGAAIKSTGVYGNNAPIIAEGSEYFRLSKLQLKSSTLAINAYSVQNCFVDRCLMEVDGDDPVAVLDAGTFTNSLFINTSSNTGRLLSVYAQGSPATATYANCTVVSLGVSVTNMLWGQYGTRSFINCAFLGCSNLVDPTSGGTFNFTNCYTDDASPPSGCSTIALDTSTGSGFENITVGTHDLRIKSTSALKNSGTSTGAPSADIMGTSRPQGASYDVGVWEYLDATPASGPHIRKFGPKLENIFHNPR